jgi:uncharacterized protein YdcH (DUF465 family)
MKLHDSEMEYLKKALPDIIPDIEVYAGMDPDFKKLCGDYEDLAEAIIYMQNTNKGNNKTLNTQLEQNVQLQKEILNEIVNFIKEEQI